MNGITEPRVESYMYSLIPKRDPVLVEMEERADRENIPIIGPVVARVLYQYAMISGARSVFEMGSAIGYSTIWLARAVGPTGRVFYTDGSRKNADHARAYFERAGVADRIEILVGDSIELIESSSSDFDLIFNDVDKYQYPDALLRAVPRLKRGGLLITDNTLWYGKVATDASDRDTEGVREFNRLAYASPELYTTILPIRDGLAISWKH